MRRIDPRLLSMLLIYITAFVSVVAHSSTMANPGARQHPLKYLGRLKYLDGIARRIFGYYLFATRTGNDIIAKRNTCSIH